jgi:polyhydroxybutyrate depolymerase
LGVFALVLALLSGCSVATDPVDYEEFVRAEGEGELGIWVHSGLYNRTYFLHTPPNLGEGGNRPLMIFLHGSGGTGESFYKRLKPDGVTDPAGIITVFPDGLGGTWSVGCDECTQAEAMEADDVSFLQTLARTLSESLPIDTTQVYVAGYSQGGSLAYLYGCRAANPPAGIATVGGLAYRSIESGCTPSRPFPVMNIHGTHDLFAYYGGYGFAAPLQSVLETMGMWVDVMGCDPDPGVSEYPNTVEDFTSITTFSWTGCRGGVPVVHHRVELGGHTWPGPNGPWSPILGNHNRDMDATREMVELFRSQGQG